MLLKEISLVDESTHNSEYDYHKMVRDVCQVPLLLCMSVFAVYVTAILFFDENIIRKNKIRFSDGFIIH